MLLAALPPEVVFNVLDFVRTAEEPTSATRLKRTTVHSPSIQSISLVSRYLCEIARTIIFEELCWITDFGRTSDPHTDSGEKTREKARRCCELLIAQPDLRRHVRTVRVYGEYLHPDGNYMEEDLPLFQLVEQVVPLLSGLTSLQLNDLPITLKLYHAFRSLEKLETLSLRECSLWRPDIPAMAAHAGPIGVRTLRAEALVQLADDEEQTRKAWSNLIFSPTIENLAMNNVLAIAAAKEITTRGGLQSVKTLGVLLRWDRREEAETIELLGRCDGVEDLTIFLERKDRIIPVALPQQHLPNLTAYRGAFGCAEEFIKGRPIKCIDLTTSLRPREFADEFRRPDNPSLLKTLTGSTVPVTYLRFGVIWWNNSFFAEVAKLFPDLETLRIDNRAAFIAEDWRNNDGTDTIKKMKNLQSITITVSQCLAPDIARQKEVILAWEAVTPSLREVVLTRFQRWTRGVDGQWILTRIPEGPRNGWYWP